MLSGLLITLDILVCIALVAIVLLQRSEGGAFGMGGGPTGLITTRGAGDLLTRTTWVLFSLFLVLSVGLTLLGAHDKATSNVLSKLKLQQANPNALSQPIAPPPDRARRRSADRAGPAGAAQRAGAPGRAACSRSGRRAAPRDASAQCAGPLSRPRRRSKRPRRKQPRRTHAGSARAAARARRASALRCRRPKVANRASEH